MIRRSCISHLGKDVQDENEPSPMEMVANISDAMLVFAVALMVALVARMGVDLSALKLDSSSLEAIEPADVAMGESTSSDGSGQFTEVGKVYQDQNGDLYLLGN